MRALILLMALSLNAGADCILDGAFVPRCIGPVPVEYEGVSYPVFTADNPKEVMAESDRRDPGTLVPYLPRSQAPITVKHVRIDTYHGKKASQTCFDTMEITER